MNPKLFSKALSQRAARVLNTEPSTPLQREFASKFLPDDPMFKVVSNLYEVVPEILGKTGKV